MLRNAISGAVVALVAAILAVTGEAIGITTVWPVLLAVAVGLALAPMALGRMLAFALGSVVSWAVLAMDAAALPQAAASDVIVVVVGVVVLTVIALLTADHVPLWAGLAGYAAFAGLYEPMYAAAPTLFLSESPVALATVLLAAAIGAVTVAVIDLVTGGAPARSDDDLADLPSMSEGGAA